MKKLLRTLILCTICVLCITGFAACDNFNFFKNGNDDSVNGTVISDGKIAIYTQSKSIRFIVKAENEQSFIAMLPTICDMIQSESFISAANDIYQQEYDTNGNISKNAITVRYGEGMTLTVSYQDNNQTDVNNKLNAYVKAIRSELPSYFGELISDIEIE